MDTSPPKAVVLLSGGADSATTLYMAKRSGYACYAITINYGQRAYAELDAAKKIALAAHVIEHRFIQIDLAQFNASALTDNTVPLPQYTPSSGIPSTYVPARNTIFLSLALSYAESLDCQDIFIGAHILDYNHYPDCRPDYFEAFTHMATLGTKRGQLRGEQAFTIQTPLIQMNKAEILQLGTQLGVNFADTVSCYAANEQGQACHHCASCELRANGFKAAGIADPTRYQAKG